MGGEIIHHGGTEDTEKTRIGLARRAKKTFLCGLSFAVLAVLSERSERAVKKKNLNREDHEGREEKHSDSNC